MRRQHGGLRGDERQRDEHADDDPPALLDATRLIRELGLNNGNVRTGDWLTVADERAAVGKPLDHRGEATRQAAREPQAGDDSQPGGVEEHIPLADVGAVDDQLPDDDRRDRERRHRREGDGGTLADPAHVSQSRRSRGRCQCGPCLSPTPRAHRRLSL